MVPSPWLPPLARWALLVGMLGAAAGGASYASWASEWSRSKPSPLRCAPALGMRLTLPETQSGSEPVDAGDGRTVYLTPTAERAVRCVSGFGEHKASRLAAALAEEDPDARATALLALMEAIPRDASGDKEAVNVGHVASGALGGLPRSQVVIDADRTIAAIVDCRFGGAACPNTPPVPVLAWIGGVVGGLGILVALAHVVRAGVLRILARRRKAS